MLSGEGLNRDEEFLDKLRQVVLVNIGNEQFGVAQLSQEMGISRSHLYRKIQLLRGKSISYFIREIRMEEAMKLLRKNVATVSEIAYQVGFNTPSYFHKCFHDHYGYSPGEVKKMIDDPKKKIGPVVQSNKNRVIGLISKKALYLPLIAILSIGLIIMKYYNTSSNAGNEIKSIAILPLKPLSKDKDQSYLAFGMHDAIIGELGKISGLRVISKTSTLRYLEDTNKLLPDIARELGVQAIIEGSVFISGDSVRLQIQLIEVFPKERHLWAQEYYEKIGDVLSVQSQLVQDIASEINVNLTPDENRLLKHPRAIDSETYKHYLRGMYYINNASQDGFEKGIMHLKNAIESDPADPYAYSGLALGYAILGHGQNSKQYAMRRAKAAALQALKLDENIASAHTALGMVYLYYDWDWEKAKKEFDIALKINPNSEIAHAHLAWLYVLQNENKLAIEQASLATEINPLYPTYQLWLGWMHQMLGNHSQAIQEVRKLLEFEPNLTFPHFVIGSVYYDQGRYEDAILEYEKIGWKNDMILAALGGAYANLGKKPKAMEILDQMHLMNAKESVNPVYMAFLQATLHEKDSAMVYLNEAYEGKMYPLPWVKYIDAFKAMKKDSAFIALYQKLNLTL